MNDSSPPLIGFLKEKKKKWNTFINVRSLHIIFHRTNSQLFIQRMDIFQTFLFSQKENYFPSGVLLFWLFIVKETQKRFHSIYNWWVFFKVLAWIVHSLNMLEILLSFIFEIGCQVFKWLANCDRFRISLSTKQYIFGWSWC